MPILLPMFLPWPVVRLLKTRNRGTVYVWYSWEPLLIPGNIVGFAIRPQAGYTLAGQAVVGARRPVMLLRLKTYTACPCSLISGNCLAAESLLFLTGRKRSSVRWILVTGDLKNRLFRLADNFYENPQANIPQACGSRAATKAAYRFFQHHAMKLKEALTGHYQATAKRIKEYTGVVLTAHDTTAFTEEGVPLGLIDV